MTTYGAQSDFMDLKSLKCAKLAAQKQFSFRGKSFHKHQFLLLQKVKKKKNKCIFDEIMNRKSR